MCEDLQGKICAANNTDMKRYDRQKIGTISSFNGSSLLFVTLTLQDSRLHEVPCYNVRVRLIYSSPNSRACSHLRYKVEEIGLLGQQTLLAVGR